MSHIFFPHSTAKYIRLIKGKCTKQDKYCNFVIKRVNPSYLFLDNTCGLVQYSRQKCIESRESSEDVKCT